MPGFHNLPIPSKRWGNHGSRLARHLFEEAYRRHMRKRRDERDPDLGGVPVEPDRPNTLIGGAEAELDFED